MHKHVSAPLRNCCSLGYVGSLSVLKHVEAVGRAALGLYTCRRVEQSSFKVSEDCSRATHGSANAERGVKAREASDWQARCTCCKAQQQAPFLRDGHLKWIRTRSMYANLCAKVTGQSPEPLNLVRWMSRTWRCSSHLYLYAVRIVSIVCCVSSPVIYIYRWRSGQQHCQLTLCKNSCAKIAFLSWNRSVLDGQGWRPTYHSVIDAGVDSLLNQRTLFSHSSLWIPCQVLAACACCCTSV
jgi:hypothetical protein